MHVCRHPLVETLPDYTSLLNFIKYPVSMHLYSAFRAAIIPQSLVIDMKGL